jgi:hypothetical protein
MPLPTQLSGRAAMTEGNTLEAERNILYDRLVPVEWEEITTILVGLLYLITL